jgi:hypothetical protein
VHERAPHSHGRCPCVPPQRPPEPASHERYEPVGVLPGSEQPGGRFLPSAAEEFFAAQRGQGDRRRHQGRNAAYGLTGQKPVGRC